MKTISANPAAPDFAQIAHDAIAANPIGAFYGAAIVLGVALYVFREVL